jgi:hypothetical protein
MPVITYSHDEYRALELVNESLQRRLDAAETMRPQWAQGYTSDGVAAQMKAQALQQVWTALGVDNQTDCMTALRKLTEPDERQPIYQVRSPAGDINSWVDVTRERYHRFAAEPGFGARIVYAS